MTIERRDCQPCQMIAEVASLLRVRSDAKGLPLVIEFIGAIPETIQSDATRLRQILINLIGNAIKFTEAGSVRLVTRFVADDAKGVVQAPRSVLQSCRILLAEDGADNQRLISFFLKKAGADATVVENGKLALDAALAARDEGRPFDAILMDMQMPVMDGYEATGQLRRKDYTAPIIALTANAMDGDREKCIKAGCDDYATKPIDRKKLIAIIETHLHLATA